MASIGSAAPYAPLAGDGELERDLLALSNDARQAAGLGALEPATRSGSFVRTLRENLALVGEAGTAQASVSGWLGSPSHRANLLHPDFTHVGFGTAPYPDGRIAVAQVLGYQPTTLEEAQLSATVALTAAGEVALFYDEHSSPPQPLAAGEHTLMVPLSNPLPLSVQLGLRDAGTSDSFILQDDGWLRETGWQGTARGTATTVPEAAAQLLAVGLDEALARALELRLTFDETPPPLGAWQGGTLLPLEVDGATVRVTLTEAQTDEPVHLGEAQGDGRYTVVYSLQVYSPHPHTEGGLRVLPLSE